MKKIIEWIKANLDIRFVVRRLHRRLMNCANCGDDNPLGLPIECGYKDDFIRISHIKAEDLYCPMWTRKNTRNI
jgi:nitroimidazol reductase NimA-like FMN-containing flavoprotein (pyridoxamine 5'-phosphate oxidase superfamily)